nr:hypothetical protein [uncultured Desulfobulbus sp.]
MIPPIFDEFRVLWIKFLPYIIRSASLRYESGTSKPLLFFPLLFQGPFDRFIYIGPLPSITMYRYVFAHFPIGHNRGADQRRVPRKQAQLDCVVRGVWSSSLFWREATGQGA